MKESYLSICLHRISDEYSPAYPPIPVKVFERYIKFLKRKYGFISLNDLQNNKTNKGGILLTFDDAYYDFYENAFPILQKYEVPAVLAVITECADTGKSFWTQELNKIIEAFFKEKRQNELSKLNFLKNHSLSFNSVEQTALEIYKILLPIKEKNSALMELKTLLGKPVEFTKMMTWKELKEVHKAGISIASHTVNHLNLTTLNDEELKYELKQSKTKIEEELNTIISVIAYPNGEFNDKVLEFSKKMGYNFAFSVENKSFQISDKDFQIIPRILVYHQKFWKLCLQFIKLRIENH